MPKILRILNRLNIGGPTYNAAYLSKYLNQTYQTRVLAGIKEPYEGSSEYVLDDLGVNYNYVSSMRRALNPVKDLQAYQTIKNEINTYQPDIVHTHAAKAGALGRLAAYTSRNRPKAIIHTYHGNVFDGYFSPLKTKVFLSIERYLCSISNAIVAISDLQKKDLVEKYKIAPAEKIHVIKLGFGLEKFAREREAKRKLFRQFYQIDEDTVVVNITGRLTAVKNHSLFIEAIKCLKEQYPQLKLKFFIVGDGELFDDIVQSAKNNGLTVCLPTEEDYSKEIIITSWRKDIDVINAGSDIVALTSINEGTPVSIIEALASKKAVICTDVGGVRDVVKNNGVLCAQDAKDFAARLYQLTTDKSMRETLAARGEEATIAEYSYTRLVEDMQLLYDRLLFDH